MKTWTRIVALAVASGLVACSPASAGSKATKPAPVVEAPAVHPVSGLRVITLTATTATGAHRFAVEIAATFAEQEKGLMFRTAMGADEGMIFPYDPPQRTAFWMKNTVLPLDIIFVGADHRVLNVAANARPYDLTPLPSAGPVSGVLELNAGRAAQLGIGPGTLITW